MVLTPRASWEDREPHRQPFLNGNPFDSLVTSNVSSAQLVDQFVTMSRGNHYNPPPSEDTSSFDLPSIHASIVAQVDQFNNLVRDVSSRVMTSMAIQFGRREKQGDCKNAFVQSWLPDDR